MLSKDEQKILFKYFKPGFQIKIFDEGLLICYYLIYVYEEKDSQYVALFRKEYHNIEEDTTRILHEGNFLKPDVSINDIVDYIKEEMKDAFTEEFNKQKQAYIQQTTEKKMALFRQNLQRMSNSLIGKELGQLTSNNLVGVEYHFTNYVNMEYPIDLTLKVGNNKYYVVKNIYDFFKAIHFDDVITYGQQLSFVHRLINFKEEDRKMLQLLDGLVDVEKPSKEIKIYGNTMHLIFDTLKERYIFFNKKRYYVRLNPIDVEVSVDSDYRLHTNITKEYRLIRTLRDIYALNEKTCIIDVVNCSFNERELVLFSHQYNGFNIQLAKDDFKQLFFLHYQDKIKVDPTLENDFKPNLVEIEAYFDYESSTILVKTVLKKDGHIVSENDEADYFDSKKCTKYFDYLDNLGFVDGILKDEDGIYRFLTMDFTPLKKLCKVYLSDAISSKQIVKFSVPTLHVQYQNNLLSFLLEDSQYSDEELYKILKEIRKKHKFFALDKNTIIDLNNQDAIQFDNLVSDLKLNEKALTKEIEKPLYNSFKLQNYKSNVTLDEHVEAIIQDIANFKKAPFDLPKINATLRPYQMDGFNWLKILSKYNLGGILADDMGLGKTLEIITLLKSDETKMPSLIVCPKSLIFNWHNEYQKFDPDTKVIEIYGSQNDRKEIIEHIRKDEKVVYISSYDSLRNDEEIQKHRFNYIIIDEGQYIKNANTKKTKTVKELKAIHRFALTGTPIENNIFDLWSLFDFIMPDYLPDLSTFKSLANDESYLQSLSKKIAPFILRRTKQEVLLDLPNKYERVVTSELTSEQEKIYDAYVLKAKEALNSDQQLIGILSIITRLRQICVDPRTFMENYEGTSGKMEALIDLLDEYIHNQHRMIVFSQFVSALDLVEQRLIEKKIPYYKLTGDTKAKDRVELAEKFNNNNEIKVFLISLKAGGTGLNLIGADTIIHLDPWWNVAAENQATDRSHRIGQTKNVEVIRLICRDTIEQRVIELQEMKKDLIDKLISNDDSSITKLSKEDLNFILR